MRAVYVRSLVMLAWLVALVLGSLFASGRPGTAGVAPPATIGASYGRR
jgi:hypothetical protein